MRLSTGMERRCSRSGIPVEKERQKKDKMNINCKFAQENNKKYKKHLRMA